MAGKKLLLVDLGTPFGLSMFFDNVIKELRNPEQWTKGALQKGAAFCIEGALAEVFRYTDHKGSEVPKTALSGLLRRALKTGYSITTFNDNSALLHADMLDQLKEAVARIRSGEVTL